MSLLRLVSAERRIQWDTFTVEDEFATGFLVNAGIAIISEKMLQLMLSYQKWRGFRYLGEDGVYHIGYGIGDANAAQGYTEAESFSEWISDIRNKQKIVRVQLPIVGITPAVFDALVSLYVDTGTWRTVQADEGTYDLVDAVQNRNWLLVADMLSRGNVNPDRRRQEARVVQLGNYAITKDRQQLRTEGLHFIRIQYVNGMSNEFEKKQAEFSYYRQLGAFLPSMSQLRQRRIVAQAII